MKSAILLPIVAILGATALSSLFIVDEREKALVLQFGQVKQVKEEPGLGFKIPLIQEVVRYDGRILGLPRPRSKSPCSTTAVSSSMPSRAGASSMR